MPNRRMAIMSTTVIHYNKGPKNNNRYTLVVLWLIE